MNHVVTLVLLASLVAAIISNQVVWAKDLINTDMLLSERWYVIKNDSQNTATKMNFRAYAGQFDNESGKVVGITNVLTFTCSKSGHYFNFSFPRELIISSLTGLKHAEAVHVAVVDHSFNKIASINGRRSGENSIYFDSMNNDKGIMNIPNNMANNILVLKSRKGEVAVNIVAKDSFSQNVEAGLRDGGLVVEHSYTDIKDVSVACLRFTGLNLAE